MAAELAKDSVEGGITSTTCGGVIAPATAASPPPDLASGALLFRSAARGEVGAIGTSGCGGAVRSRVPVGEEAAEAVRLTVF